MSQDDRDSSYDRNPLDSYDRNPLDSYDRNPLYDREKGIEMFNTVYCGDIPNPPERGVSKFTDFMLDTLFGVLWADETLSIRDRRLLLLGAIAAQGEENTFSIQARSALKRGELTREQLETVVVFLTQYIGYPRGSKMFMALNKILAEAG